MNTFSDVTTVLPAVRTPALLIYRSGDTDVKIEEGRYIASQLPDARLIELDGADHFFWAGDAEPISANAARGPCQVRQLRSA